jgi:hypothetical protein
MPSAIEVWSDCTSGCVKFRAELFGHFAATFTGRVREFVS